MTMNLDDDTTSVTKVPNEPVNSKIVWTAIVAAIINIIVILGWIPEETGKALIGEFNVLILGLIAFFRIYKTISPEQIRLLQHFRSMR